MPEAPLSCAEADSQMSGERPSQHDNVRRVIRVAEVEQSGYMMPTGTGIMRGYDAEYMYKIAQRGNFELQFISYADYVQVLDALERGEVDMAVGVARTPERAEKFLFAKDPFGSASLSLCVRIGNNSYEYGNLEQIKTMKIGVLKNSSMESFAEKWAAERGIEIYHAYSSVETLYDALQNGEIDAIVSGLALMRYTRVIDHFVSESYYPTFRKDDYNLKSIFDAAKDRLMLEEPMVEPMLRSKYARQEEGNGIALSADEKEYLGRHSEISVAVVGNNMPYYDVRDGEETGFIPKFYSDIGKALKIDFVYKPYRSYQAALDAVKSGDADIIGIANMDAVMATELDLILTAPYSSQSIVAVTDKGRGELRRVAVTSDDNVMMRRLLADNPTIESFEVFDNLEKCHEALHEDEVDGIVCCFDMGAWLINNHRGSKWTIISLSKPNWVLCGAVNQRDEMLASVISKAVVDSRIDISNAIAETLPTRNSLMMLIENMPVIWLVAIFIIILAIISAIFGLVYYSRLQRNKVEVAMAEAELMAAEQAKKAEADFLSNMSHDMRTPLNGILGFTELALRDHDPVHRDEYLQKIQLSSHLMRDIVNDVLDLSKIESGRMDLHPVATDLGRHCENITASVQLLAMRKSIHFDSLLDDVKGVWVMIDNVRFQQVALNLLSNAVKYTPNSGRVRFEAEATIEDGICHLRIVVSDNGIGMSEDFQKHMFEPFSQEVQSGTEKVTGTGLGLAIVKRIVDLMDGKIEVRSHLGEGTTFIVTMAAPITEPVDDALPDEGATPGIDGMRFLLCEDNDINAEIATLLLEGMGAKEIDRAENGKIGLEKFADSGIGYYDVILMDLRMPVMNGIEATKAIRALDRDDARTIPIIAMTADAYADDVEHCKAAGMNDHLSKPIDVTQMRICLARHYKG